MHKPSGLVAQAEFSAERQRGFAPLIHGNEENRQKPDPQGQFGSMKNRTGRDRILMATRTTFIEGLGASRSMHRPALGLLAFRAQKPLRPPLSKQVGLARFLSPKLVLPVDQRHRVHPPQAQEFTPILACFPPLRSSSLT